MQARTSNSIGKLPMIVTTNLSKDDNYRLEPVFSKDFDVVLRYFAKTLGFAITAQVLENIISENGPVQASYALAALTIYNTNQPNELRKPQTLSSSARQNIGVTLKSLNLRLKDLDSIRDDLESYNPENQEYFRTLLERTANQYQPVSAFATALFSNSSTIGRYLRGLSYPNEAKREDYRLKLLALIMLARQTLLGQMHIINQLCAATGVEYMEFVSAFDTSLKKPGKRPKHGPPLFLLAEDQLRREQV